MCRSRKGATRSVRSGQVAGAIWEGRVSVRKVMEREGGGAPGQYGRKGYRDLRGGGFISFFPLRGCIFILERLGDMDTATGIIIASLCLR